MNILKKNWHLILLTILTVLFFLTTSYFNYKTQEFQKSTGEGVDFVKWTSPDETANYVFTKYYAQENKLIIRENYNLMASDIMRPRSFRSDHGDIKPVSFLGIILVYGTIAKVFSYRVIPFLTPLFASFGLIFFYLLVRKIFSKENALMSTFILAFFPSYVYYTVRSMFHNVLFTVFLVIALYFGVMMVERFEGTKKKTILKGLFFAMLSGLFLGLSVITRTSELMWILPMVLVIWIFNIRKIGFYRPIVFLVFLLVALLPVFHFNTILYGAPLSGGYSEMNSSIQNLKDSGSQIFQTTVSGNFKNYAGIIAKVKETLFYFGIHPRQSAHMFLYYFVEMFNWLFWLGSAGILLFVAKFKKSKKRQWVFLLSLSVISFILVIYYGSWTFYDNPDPRSHTIGNSYTRYWLPMYLGMIPFFVYLLVQISRTIAKVVISKNERVGHVFFNFHISRKFFTNAMRAIVLIAIFFWSANFLLAGSEEGLVYLYEKSTRTRAEWRDLISLTENNSVLITRYHDKLVFPERKVIVGDFTDPNMVVIYAELAGKLPVYYYNFSLPPKDVEYLNTRKLVEFGIQLKVIKRLNYDFTLYKIVKTK
ncbi:glycosyltransferase family 39 protein [Patescibacteria group bacterium]|nr:glycosyltransferase family 39 protein [Patescibacteria group bacterium]